MGFAQVCDGEIISAKTGAATNAGSSRPSSIILFIGSPLYGRCVLTIDHLKRATQGLFTSASDPNRTSGMPSSFLE